MAGSRVAPLDALKTFVDIYGRAFTVGQSASKKFFLDETYPLADFDPSAVPFVLPNEPGHQLSATIRARKSDLGLASVAIGYVIAYDKYSSDLANAGIQLAFS